MLCPKCGTEVSDDHSVCLKCGQPLPVSPSPVITSAVPHITSFSFSNPPPTPKVVGGSIVPPPLSAPRLRKHSNRWMIYTLIFVIIAVIGVYFSGLFISLNPLEKSRQAKDMVMKNNLTAILQSLDTYNAANSRYPWTSNVADGYSTLNIAAESWVTDLSASASVKSSPSKIVLIQGPGASQPVHLCYLPQAQANKNIVKDKCFSDHFYQQFSASICVKNRGYLCFP